jgi:pimeloyl-ACP methyl ester carboxylesterase
LGPTGAPPATQPTAPTPAPTGAAPATSAPAPAAVTPLAHIEIRGSGPIPIILIPGLVSDWSVFDSFMTRNDSRYTMYAITLPGFGKSDPPPTPPDGTPFAAGTWLDNAERAILQLVDARKLDKPALLGQSMGGHLALRLAAHHPDSFRALIIVNSMPAWPLRGPGQEVTKQDRAKMVDQSLAPEVKQISEKEWSEQQAAWIKDSVADPDRAKDLIARAAVVPQAVSARYMLEYLASDLGDDAAKITIPTLVLAPVPAAGDRSGAGVREMWTSLYAAIKKTTIAYFENSHEFITEDSPAELDRAVEAFLAGKPVEGKVAGTTSAATPPAQDAAPPAPAPKPDAAPSAPKPPEPK